MQTHQRAEDIIGITLGEPTGIGPEIVAAAIAAVPTETRRRLMVFGDRPIIDRAFAQVHGSRVPDDVHIVDRGLLDPAHALCGQPSAASGAAQVAYLEAAVAAARGGSISALVTAPIDKFSAKRAGFTSPGHTEFLAERLGAEHVAMMFVGPRLRVVLATVHLAVADVARTLDLETIATVTRLGAEAMQRDFACPAPRIGIVGLNPHAGEQGLFGREEIDIIEPAIAACRRTLSQPIAGPLVPDAAFRRASTGEFDLLVAMYHDQALIPIKLIDFEQAVNVTLGLPIVRTSPDHGVAYDLAGKGHARPQSFIAALRLADEMLGRRRAYRETGQS